MPRDRRMGLTRTRDTGAFAVLQQNKDQLPGQWVGQPPRIPWMPVETLNLYFLNGPLDSRITFTRASATATRVTQAGLIETLTTDQPRFDYDPVTLSARGLLLEEQRTNLFLQSANFGTTWVPAQVSVAVNQVVSPDGGTNADWITETAVTNIHQVNQNITVTAVPTTLCCYAKAGVRRRIMLREDTTSGDASIFDLVSANVVANLASGVGSITSIGNGWYRCAMTHTPTAGAKQYGIYCMPDSGTIYADAIYLGVVNRGVYLWGAQLEAGSFPTSYIPTTSAAVTRAADVASMTETNFSSWFNATEGTFVVSCDVIGNAAIQQTAYSVNNGTSSERMQVGRTGTSPQVLFVSTVSGVYINITPGSWLLNTGMKLANAYKNADYSMAVNGGSLTLLNTVGTLPNPDRLTIGTRYDINTCILNGHIQRLTYYNKRLPDATLQALST